MLLWSRKILQRCVDQLFTQPVQRIRPWGLHPHRGVGRDKSTMLHDDLALVRPVAVRVTVARRCPPPVGAQRFRFGGSRTRSASSGSHSRRCSSSRPRRRVPWILAGSLGHTHTERPVRMLPLGLAYHTTVRGPPRSSAPIRRPPGVPVPRCHRAAPVAAPPALGPWGRGPGRTHGRPGRGHPGRKTRRAFQADSSDDRNTPSRAPPLRQIWGKLGSVAPAPPQRPGWLRVRFRAQVLPTPHRFHQAFLRA